MTGGLFLICWFIKLHRNCSSNLCLEELWLMGKRELWWCLWLGSQEVEFEKKIQAQLPREGAAMSLRSLHWDEPGMWARFREGTWVEHQQRAIQALFTGQTCLLVKFFSIWRALWGVMPPLPLQRENWNMESFMQSQRNNYQSWYLNPNLQTPTSISSTWQIDSTWQPGNFPMMKYLEMLAKIQ